MPSTKSYPLDSTRLAANRANARKSTGPRSEEGKRRTSLNLPSAGTRLLGLAEARTLNQEPEAAQKLYQQLIAPFEPAPALVRMQLEDLARLQLELRAWEEIRDAQLDHRAQQNSLEVRARYREADRDLAASLKEVSDTGLRGLPDSPARFNAQLEALAVLKEHLKRREYAGLATPLQRLYGTKLEPGYERGELICFDCRRLMNPAPQDPVTEEELACLIRLVEREETDALEGCELALDARTETGSASRSRLAARREDHWMNLQGDQLRRAIDRNLRTLPNLLKSLGLSDRLGRGAKSRKKTKARRSKPFRQSHEVPQNE